MREILFKGKRSDNGEWIEGCLTMSKPNSVDGGCSAWIQPISIMPFGAISTPTKAFFQVSPNSVGQFTGLVDKNGVKIFEGDIINVPYNYIGCKEVGFLEGKFSAADYNIKLVEVVGNIQDKKSKP